MEDLKYIAKVTGLWLLLQLGWAGIGLGVIYALDLTPSDLQLYAYVGVPYLILMLLSLYDSYYPGRIKSIFLG